MQSPLPLLQSISKYIQLTTEEENFFLSLLQTKKIKRKQFVMQEGDINNSSKFVLAGLLRLYSVDKNGIEHIIQFAPVGWWIGDLRSYHRQEPSTLFIDAIEDTEIIEIPRPAMDQLMAEIPKLERFFRILAENALAAYQQRLVANLSLPAKERFSCFVEQYPSLLQQLPQKYIASYIGVTPEFLSKMLNQPSSSK
jgi:CRP-like cAMP-binding protein